MRFFALAIPPVLATLVFVASSCRSVAAQTTELPPSQVAQFIERFEARMNSEPALLEELRGELERLHSLISSTAEAALLPPVNGGACERASVDRTAQGFDILFQRETSPFKTDQSEPLLPLSEMCDSFLIGVTIPGESLRLPTEISEILNGPDFPTPHPSPTPTPRPTPLPPSGYSSVQPMRFQCLQMPKRQLWEEYGWYNVDVDSDPSGRRTTVSVTSGDKLVRLGGDGEWRFGGIFSGRWEREHHPDGNIQTFSHMNFGLGFSGRIGKFETTFRCFAATDFESR